MKAHRVFLIYEPSEMGSTIEPEKEDWISKFIVGVVVADTIGEAVSFIGGKFVVPRKKELIVWLPIEHFFEVWNGKRYKAEASPDYVKNFECLLWQFNHDKVVSLGTITPLIDTERKHYGLAIKEISLLPP